MPPGTRWTRPRGGHAVWVTLPPGVDGVALQEDAIAAGIRYGRGDAFSFDGRFTDCLNLSFISQDKDGIEGGIEALGELVARYTEG